jgi:23S rRNA (pseudouridine1915-N3)-methyltransferase
MRIRLILLGKTRRPEIRVLLDDYAGRIRRNANLEILEVREVSAAALRRLDAAAGATVVLLDAEGTRFDSAQFADWLGRCRDGGVRELVFLCGAAEGFPEALARRATKRIALSPMTFSHELARVMLAEQIYRAFALLAGHPYPK